MTSLPPSSAGDAGDVTRILARLQQGDVHAADDLFPLVYQELRDVARRAMARESVGHTLQPTALVNEAYLKLAGGAAPPVDNRGHFFAVAARAMRQILVDHARRRNAARRGGGEVHAVTLGAAGADTEMPLEDVLALDQALEGLEAVETRLRQVVEFRYFAGLTDGEIADLLGVTRRTVQRDWVRARAWLNRTIYGD